MADQDQKAADKADPQLAKLRQELERTNDLLDVIARRTGLTTLFAFAVGVLVALIAFGVVTISVKP